MTTFATQDTGRRQTKQKPQHDDTAQKNKNTKNRDPAKIYTLSQYFRLIDWVVFNTNFQSTVVFRLYHDVFIFDKVFV
jgi:hypothetical protein